MTQSQFIAGLTEPTRNRLSHQHSTAEYLVYEGLSTGQMSELERRAGVEGLACPVTAFAQMTIGVFSTLSD